MNQKYAVRTQPEHNAHGSNSKGRLHSVPMYDSIILLVSDNDFETAIVRQHLRDMRCGAVLVEKSAASALNIMRNIEVGVLISRNELPDLIAFKFLRIIQGNSRRYKKPMATLVYSNDARQAAIEVVAQAEPDAVLLWPFSFDQFRERVVGIFQRAANRKHDLAVKMLDGLAAVQSADEAFEAAGLPQAS
jgi:DNA-binding response OmpR family regulator